MSAQIIAFRTPGAPAPIDPPVYVPIHRPKPTPRLTPNQRRGVNLLQEFAAKMGLEIEVRVAGEASS
jgi:hypothetical protein